MARPRGMGRNGETTRKNAMARLREEEWHYSRERRKLEGKRAKNPKRRGYERGC